MKLVLFLGLFMFSFSAFSLTDFACSSRCMSAGSSLQFCNAQCSTDDAPAATWSTGVYQPTQNMKQVDYACVNRCTGNGVMYDVCHDRCSY